jgi:hypothetical protein
MRWRATVVAPRQEAWRGFHPKWPTPSVAAEEGSTVDQDGRSGPRRPRSGHPPPENPAHPWNPVRHRSQAGSHVRRVIAARRIPAQSKSSSSRRSGQLSHAPQQTTLTSQSRRRSRSATRQPWVGPSEHQPSAVQQARQAPAGGRTLLPPKRAKPRAVGHKENRRQARIRLGGGRFRPWAARIWAANQPPRRRSRRLQGGRARTPCHPRWKEDLAEADPNSLQTQDPVAGASDPLADWPTAPEGEGGRWRGGTRGWRAGGGGEREERAQGRPF